MKGDWGGNSKEYVQGMIVMAFIGVAILYYADVLSGGWAFMAMVVVLGIGSANSDR